jgi:tRNA (guanine-N7-)-methyltransferase
MTESRPHYQINLTRDLKHPNEYTLALDGEFRNLAFNEERAPLNQGKWREQVFDMSNATPLDLEVGTGNGLHFEYHAMKYPERLLVGFEIKYKPLIQTIRRATKAGAKNASVARVHAFNVDKIFSPQELNDVYIHFPDPWVSPRKPKNRFVQKRNLDLLWDLQRPGAKIDFKTDSREYFIWAMEQIRESKYQIEFETLDLHRSEFSSENFETAFEKIFLRQNIEINFVRLRRGN